MTGDPCERRNLIAVPERQAEIVAMRAELLALLRRTGDPLAEAFAHRDNPQLVQEAMRKLKSEYERAPENKSREGKQKKENQIQPAGDVADAAEE